MWKRFLSSYSLVVCIQACNCRISQMHDCPFIFTIVTMTQQSFVNFSSSIMPSFGHFYYSTRLPFEYIIFYWSENKLYVLQWCTRFIKNVFQRNIIKALWLQVHALSFCFINYQGTNYVDLFVDNSNGKWSGC